MGDARRWRVAHSTGFEKRTAGHKGEVFQTAARNPVQFYTSNPKVQLEPGVSNLERRAAIMLAKNDRATQDQALLRWVS